MRVHLRLHLFPAFLLLLVPASGGAQPWPGTSTVPIGMTLVGTHNGVPDPYGLFTITVKTPSGDPILGSLVTIDLSNCPDLDLSSIQPYPGETVDCIHHSVAQHTDFDGKARFIVLGSAARRCTVQVCSAFKCAEVRADPGNVVLGNINVAALDLDGVNGLDLHDLGWWLYDFGVGQYCSREDYDHVAGIGANDLSLLLCEYTSGNSDESPPRCSGVTPPYPVVTASDGGLNLAWGDCYDGTGTKVQTSDCSTNSGSPYRLVASMSAPSGADFVTGIEAEIDVIAAPGQSIPDWWRFDASGCRPGALSLVVPPTSTTTCGDVGDPESVLGQCHATRSQVTWPVNGDPGREKITVTLFYNMLQISPIPTGADLHLFDLDISRALSAGGGACVGCNQPVQVVFSSARLLQIGCDYPSQHPTILLDKPATNNEVTWQGGRIEGLVFNDLSHDGHLDNGEPGLSGRTIQLRVGTSVSRTTLTLGDGSYAFDGVAPGAYTVAELTPSGWLDTAPPSGMFGVTVVSGATIPGLNFGNWQPPAPAPCWKVPNASLLQIWYTFDEQSGGTAHETATANGLDGHWVGGAHGVSTGRVDGALFVPSQNSFVVAGSKAQNNFGGHESFTIDAWILLEVSLSSGARVIVEKREQAGPSMLGYMLYVMGNTGQLALELDDGTPIAATFIAQTPDLRVAGWHHVAAVVSRAGQNGAVQLFVDTAVPRPLQGPIPNVPTGSLSNARAMLIGQSGLPTPATQAFAGLIDELEIFHTALSVGRIAAIQNAGSNGKCKVDFRLFPPGSIICYNGTPRQLRIVNHSGSPRSFQWTMSPRVGSGCPAGGPSVFIAPAGTATNVMPYVQSNGYFATSTSITGAKCATPNGVFCDQMLVVDQTNSSPVTLATNVIFIKDSFFCPPPCQPAPQGQAHPAFSHMSTTSDDTSIVEIPIGSSIPVEFTVANEGDTDASLSYNFAVADDDSETIQLVGLDGLPAGSPTPTQTVTIPAGGRVLLSVKVAFTDFSPLAFPDIVLSGTITGQEGMLQDFRTIHAVDLTAPASVDGSPTAQDLWSLMLRPNPFSSSLSIEFAADPGDRAEVSIFDVMGRVVRRWREPVATGRWQRASWDGRDMHGATARNGLYFVRVISGHRVLTGRIIQLNQ